MQYLEAFNTLIDELEGNSDKFSQWGGVFGIQPNHWQKYAKREGVSRKIPTRSDAYAYYRTEWWLPYRCEDLPDKLDFAFFQWTIHRGPETIKDLQLCLGVNPDGLLNPETLSAGRRCDPVKTSLNLLNRQLDWYKANNSGHSLFKWENRIAKVKKILGLS